MSLITTLHIILSHTGGGIFLSAAALLIYQVLRGGRYLGARLALAFSLPMWRLVCISPSQNPKSGVRKLL